MEYSYMYLLLALATATSAMEVSLWPGIVPGEVPGSIGPEHQRNRTMKNGYIAQQIQNVTNPTIKLFKAANCEPLGCPAVVIAPGGAYMLLSYSMEGTDVAKRFNAMGVSAVVLKYRVPDRTKYAPDKPYGWAPLQDAQRAMGMVRAAAQEWGINPSKVGFMGFSAGGHLTAHITTAWGERTYPRVDAADDLSCRPDFSLLIYPWKLLLNDDANSTVLAPEVSNVSAVTPPVMIAQNEDDPSAHVENSLMFYYHLKRAAGRTPQSALHLYPKGGHGFGMCQGEEPAAGSTAGTYEECCDWPLAAQRFMQVSSILDTAPPAPCDGVFDAGGSLTCRPTV